MTSSLKDTFSCFDVNRFIPVSSEKELEEVASGLYQNGTFLAGFVFQNLKTADTVFPPDFSIKIRTNADNVPETNIIRPWLVFKRLYL